MLPIPSERAAALLHTEEASACVKGTHQAMSNEEIRVGNAPRAVSWRTANRQARIQNRESGLPLCEQLPLASERNRFHRFPVDSRRHSGANSAENRAFADNRGGRAGRGGQRTGGAHHQRYRGKRAQPVLEQTPPESHADELVSKLNVHAEVFTPGPAPKSKSQADGRSPRKPSRPPEVGPEPTSSRSDRSSTRQPKPKSKKKFEESKAQKESLEEQLQRGTYDCMICCLQVKNTQAIWNCQMCFHIFHLRCVGEWAQKSISRENPSWRCPACQGESAALPAVYQCFCGKQKNPQCSRSCFPHSCGELCLKPRSCTHKCNQLCHPGRCPPCEAILSRLCLCAKTSIQMKCDSKVMFQCDRLCGKRLSCSKHSCEERCHSGECSPCGETKLIPCTCGEATQLVPCGNDDTFSCERPCGKTLACGNHQCSTVCHDGPCGACHLATIGTCPCGKTPLPDGWNCSEEVPLCGQLCHKTRPCGHQCADRCHSGDCPPCTAAVKGKRCRCGSIVDNAQCGQTELLCKRRCNKKKVCGRHKCLDECCDKEIHICDLACGKMLSCKLHACQVLCHKGTCPKCDNVSFDELSCHCGSSVLYPPIACNAPPPECAQLCNREHACTHPVRHPCHSDETCPPCTFLTEKRCHGGHEVRRNIPCHLENVSCGHACGKPLPCGRHRCDKICHSAQCPPKCEQACAVARDCGHPCKLPCHDSCPPSTCFANVDLTCPCGRIVESRSCHQFQLAINNQIQQRVRRGEDVNLATDLMQLARGFLKCVEQCAVETRNRKMAEGFKIDPNNTLFTSTLYTDFVKEEARRNWHFASKVVQKLNDLVELARSSPQLSRSFSFEPMPRDQRRFIYELLEVYRCTGQSYDQEPKRNIVVTAYKEKSMTPTVSLARAIGFANPLPLRKLV